MYMKPPFESLMTAPVLPDPRSGEKEASTFNISRPSWDFFQPFLILAFYLLSYNLLWVQQSPSLIWRVFAHFPREQLVFSPTIGTSRPLVSTLQTPTPFRFCTLSPIRMASSRITEPERSTSRSWRTRFQTPKAIQTSRAVTCKENVFNITSWWAHRATLLFLLWRLTRTPRHGITPCNALHPCILILPGMCFSFDSRRISKYAFLLGQQPQSLYFDFIKVLTVYMQLYTSLSKRKTLAEQKAKFSLKVCLQRPRGSVH